MVDNKEKEKSKEKEIENDGQLKNHEIDVNYWITSQIPNGRTKIDLSKNRMEYISLMLSGITYRELEAIAKDKYKEHITRQTFNNYYLKRIPEEIKNPIGRMEKFIKEAPYRVNELLMLEELVLEQRNRFFGCKTMEDQLHIPISSRSQVARDYHAALIAFQEAKMRAGLITRAPDRIEISEKLKSVSDYSPEEKTKEMERITDIIKEIGK